MRALKVTPAEQELLSQVTDALKLRRRAHKNTVCAGVIVGGGSTFLGLDVVSRKSSVCAEPTAIAHAHLHGAYDIISVAAVCFEPDLREVVVISPCGACRELIWYHAPQARILMPGDPTPVAVVAEDLFEAGDLFSPLQTDITSYA